MSKKASRQDEVDLPREQVLEHIRKLIKLLQEKYAISEADLAQAITSREGFIPSTIFSKKLSPFEGIVKYLKENEGKKLSEISALTGRNLSSVWQTYRNAVKKDSSPIKIQKTEYLIPLKVIKEKKFSILESIVIYLKDEFGLNYRKIGELLQRNERTIWTVYQRGMKKK